MRRYLFMIGLACTLVFTPLFSQTAVLAKTDSSKEPIVHIPLKRVDKKVEKNAIQSFHVEELKPVRNFTNDELKKLEKLHPFTSVSSHGEVKTIAEQSKQIKQNHAPDLKSNDETNPTFTTQTIIGSDNRSKVTNTTQYPYNAIALIETQHPNGTYYQCTGFFIDDNTVVTAAHCIYDTYLNKWFTRAYIYPAFDGVRYPYVGTTSSTFYVSTSWINVNPPSADQLYLSDTPKDYGVIKVKDGFAPTYGIGMFSIRSTNHEVGEQVNVSGYPIDKIGMWRGLGYIKALDTYRIDHDADAIQGNSGSPIFNSKRGVLAVIGVNSAESANMNHGPRIIGFTYNNLVYWAGLPY